MNNKIIKISLSFLLIFLLFSQIIQSKVFASQEPVIRVLIKQDKFLRIRSDSSIPLIVRGGPFLNEKVKGLTVKKNNKKNILFFDRDKTKLYELDNAKGFEVKSSDKRGIWVGDKRYAGKIKVTLSESQIFAVNILEIEKYLFSVVASEMPHKWPLEALKAQAIASRTYALKNRISNNFYDIDSTHNDQVYNGLEAETRRTRKAVKRTRSMVILYKDKLINALFHSSSGGMTENSEDVWGNNLSYLISVKDFDRNNPKLNWKKTFSETELEKLFPYAGGIERIKILELTGSGRIKKVEISGQWGSEILTGKQLREILNLKSTLVRFEFANTNNQKYLIIKGIGAGHGVGMSQWGAKYMAQKGFKANEILEHFYTGVEIKPFQESYV